MPPSPFTPPLLVGRRRPRWGQRRVATVAGLAAFALAQRLVASITPSDVPTTTTTTPPPPTPPTTHRYRARVAYDGSGFRGFQLQGVEEGGDRSSGNSRRTVQHVLETALSQRLPQPRAAAKPLRVVAAGRTDAGVHARGQAIHFDCANPRGGGSEIPLSDAELRHVEYSLNRMLPPDVRIFHLQRAPPPFVKEVGGMPRLVRWNAMMDCTGKLYSYRINVHPVSMDPTDRFTRWHPDHPNQIDLERLGSVLKIFEGYHDFRAFAGQVEQLEKTVGTKVDTRRLVRSVNLVDEGKCNYRIDFHLQGALYRQVRNMVGAAIDVCREAGEGRRGRTRLDEERLRCLLQIGAATRRDNPSKPAPPQGLVLEQVYFDEEGSGNPSF